MEPKKKRGPNYTTSEKEILLQIVNEFLHIIESKELNASMISKKKNAWEIVARNYNAVATSGTRTWLQLRHLYENIKQRTKKNVAKENRLHFYEKEDCKVNIDLIKQIASDDKREIIRTSTGAYKSILTETDSQILSMVTPQIKSMPNPYDDAALYYGQQVTSAYQNMNPATKCETDLQSPTEDVEQPKRSGNNLKLKQRCTVKEQYFKMKLGNAKLERKYIINKFKMEQERHKLEIRILKFRLKELSEKKN